MTAAPLLKLFAKQPVAGRAKTRLAADIGDEEAAQIATGLIIETVRLALSVWPGEVRMAVWPDASHPLFHRLRQHTRIGFERQAEGDLGDKMLAALHAGLDEGYATAVMGCDAPQCPPMALEQAAAALADGANPFGGAEDGGFWLIGLSEHAPGLFDGIDWDAPQTGAKTRESARAIGLDLDDSLPVLFDLDTVDELNRLTTEYPELAARVKGENVPGLSR